MKIQPHKNVKATSESISNHCGFPALRKSSNARELFNEMEQTDSCDQIVKGQLISKAKFEVFI